MKVEQLHYITVKWEYQYRSYSGTVEWAKMTETLWTVVILLSFGTLVWRPRTGIERCIEDKNRTFGLLRAFLRSLYDFFASPEEPCTCYEFVDGSLEDLALYLIKEFKESRNECLLFSSGNKLLYPTQYTRQKNTSVKKITQKVTSRITHYMTVREIVSMIFLIYHEA